MLMARKSSILLLVAMIAIASTPVLNYNAYGWADEYIKITLHIGVWKCGEYCGSVIVISTFINTNEHFVHFHTGTGDPENHDDGHGWEIAYERTDHAARIDWEKTCDGGVCDETDE